MKGNHHQAVLMHAIINYTQDMGWDKIPNAVENTGRSIRQIKQLQ